MKTNPQLLSSAEEIKNLADVLDKFDIIAFDVEFIRESTFFPIVEIIQIATEDESWLIDAAAFKTKTQFDPGLLPLLKIFQNERILKVVHAAQGDQECLYTSFGILASPILDTAIAASLCGHGESIGLGRLLKAVLDVSIKKGHARTNWSARPLPEQLVEYAHADVIHLVRLGRALLDKLDRQNRKQWALDLSSKWSDKSLYEPNIEDMTLRLARGAHLDGRAHAVLLELIRWREERVRELDLPRRWVADDTVLVDLARVRPKDLNHMATFRGLNKGELKNSGDAILAAINRGIAKPDTELPRISRTEAATPDESQTLELLQCFLGIVADRFNIAPRHLATQSQLLALLRKNDFSSFASHAAQLVGDELTAFINGKRALSIKNGKVIVVETEGDQNV